MDFRRLGDSGLKVSAVGLGCNNFGMRIEQAETDAVVGAALDAGINFFDTADIYGATRSEVMLGKALGEQRDEIVLATKFGNPTGPAPYGSGASRRHIQHAVEASLTRLGTDRIDLLQLHRPDPETPIEETLRALDDLIAAGKVLYVGCSNFEGWRIADADWVARTVGTHRFVSAQNLYSLLERDVEKEVLPACERFGLGFLPFFPLASGLLTGKYRRGEPPPEGTRLAVWGERGAKALSDRNFDRVEPLEAWARDRNRSILDLAFAWLLGHPVVSSVIAGATTPAQVAANAATAGWALTPEETAEVAALTA